MPARPDPNPISFSLGKPAKQLNGSYRMTITASRGKVTASCDAVFENLQSAPRQLDLEQVGGRSYRSILTNKIIEKEKSK